MADMALRKLAGELKSFEKEPLEGVTIEAVDDNLFEWSVGIFGPPDTLYAGGYFKAQLLFPQSYPYDPPKMRFLDEMFHPNVYPNGNLCISILHPPGEDEQSGELPEERWNPTQQVRTILLSVISLLNEPNTSSPANVDASVAFRKWKQKESSEYADIVGKQVSQSKRRAADEGIFVPTTRDEYCIQHKPAEPEYDWTLDDYDEDEEDFEFDEED